MSKSFSKNKAWERAQNTAHTYINLADLNSKAENCFLPFPCNCPSNENKSTGSLQLNTGKMSLELNKGKECVSITFSKKLVAIFL